MHSFAVLFLAFVACISLTSCKDLNAFRQIFQQRLQSKLNFIAVQNLKEIDGNAYVDEVLAEVKTEIDEQHLDPYKVEDIDFLGLHTEGFIAGFSTIHRNGDAAVTQTDTTLFIDVDLLIYNFEGDFNWTYTFLFVDYNGDVDGMVDIVELYLSMNGPIVSGSSTVTMQIEALDIRDIGRITIEVHGFGIFDELIDVVVQLFSNLFKEIIPIFIEGIVEVILNDVIEQIPFPLPEPAL